MKCDELQPLQGPYLDSELDARTSLEIEQHLESCPNCTRVFAEEQQFAVRLKAGLNHGQRTAALWDQIERSVSAASRPGQSPSEVPSAGRQGLLAALGTQLQAGWQRSPWAWAGLSAAWAVILALNFTARESEPPLVAGKPLPPAAEMRIAAKQRQLLMTDLAALSEPAQPNKVKSAPPSPRSDRRKETLNT
jgi:anti-sigma factor RsiW